MSPSATTTAADIQGELEALYRSELASVRGSFTEADLGVLSFPFLLNVSPDYLAAPLKLMFVGKETNRWAGKLRDFYSEPEDTFRRAVERYEIQYNKHWKRWNSPFGRQYKNAIRAAGLEGTPRATVWNNLIKMDWDRGDRNSRRALGHSRALRDFSMTLFKREVELLKPDVIVVTTGASYDGALKSCLPVSDWHDHVPHALSTFAAAGANCVRVRHPGAIPSRNFPVPTAEYYEHVARWIETLRTQPPELRRPPPSGWFNPSRKVT